jgi:hypothetical protein
MTKQFSTFSSQVYLFELLSSPISCRKKFVFLEKVLTQWIPRYKLWERERMRITYLYYSIEVVLGIKKKIFLFERERERERERCLCISPYRNINKDWVLACFLLIFGPNQ